ncbi:MAG: 2-dehydro-3-deoxygalactonokinase, partial [Alphaproteobacteria bacterium]|nr:2-dehydro-3-deoxygalactonokinase [Alphaproteobacteria bacterium]
THSKWVTTNNGAISAIRTFISGELFALLQNSSLLSEKQAWAGDDFDAGFDSGLIRACAEGSLAACLFSVRAAQVRHNHPSGFAAGYLSGLIIGAEVNEMIQVTRTSDAMQDGPLNLIGGQELVAYYARACEKYGLVTNVRDGDLCVLAGLEILDAHHR